MRNALMQPPRKTITVTVAGDTRSVTNRSANAEAIIASADSATMTNRRRSSRSASAPPTGESTPTGRKAATATSAVQEALPVASVT